MADWDKIEGELKGDDEERPRESEPNPTQERMDEEEGGDRPVDVDWTDKEGNSG
jgi:hypothetical protein